LDRGISYTLEKMGLQRQGIAIQKYRRGKTLLEKFWGGETWQGAVRIGMSV
jgi:hypothetical protein